MNNWAVSIEDYQLKFEYIKGVKNTLADTMSRLVQLDPDVALPPNQRASNLESPCKEGERQPQAVTTW